MVPWHAPAPCPPTSTPGQAWADKSLTKQAVYNTCTVTWKRPCACHPILFCSLHSLPLQTIPKISSFMPNWKKIHALINMIGTNLIMPKFSAHVWHKWKIASNISAHIWSKWMIALYHPVHRWYLYWCRITKRPQNCRTLSVRVS